MITITQVQLLAWITPLLWPLLRLLAVFAAMPVLSMRMVSMRVRIGLAFFIALSAQVSLPPPPLIPLDSHLIFSVVAQQLFVGLAMGFSIRVVFAAIELAGELIGLQMGMNFAVFFDPLLASQSTSVTRFYANMASFLFITINGHLLVIGAVIKSFEIFPVNDKPFDFIRQIRPEQWGSELFMLGLWISLPIVGLLLFINLVMGVITRIAPQMNLFSIGFPITVGMGLIGMMFSLPVMQQPFIYTIEKMLNIFM